MTAKPELVPLRPIVEPVVTLPQDQGYYCPRSDSFTLSFEITAYAD